MGGVSQSSRSQKMSDVIARLYEAAEPETGWQNAVVEMAELVDATQAALQLSSAGGNAPPRILAAPGVSSDEIKLYVEHYHRLDPFAAFGQQAVVDRVFLGQEMIHTKQLLATEYWNDYAARNGRGFHMIGVRVGGVGEQAVFLGLLRSKEQAPYSASDARDIQALVPHIRSAMRLWQRLGDADSNTSRCALMTDALGPVLVTDGLGRLLLVSPSAERLLPASGLRIARQRIGSAAPAVEARLMALIARTAAGGPGGAILTIINNRPDRGLALITRLPRASAESQRGAPPHPVLIDIGAIAINAHAEGAVRSVLDLSAAEANIALLLARGMTAEQVAKVRGSSGATVRSQIRTILAKTETMTLRELAVLVVQIGRSA